MWRTWPVYRNAPNSATLNEIREKFGLPDGEDWIRPAAGLGMVDGKLKLWTEKEEDFFQYLKRELRTNGRASILALSAAPQEDLQRIHGLVLWRSTLVNYRVTWVGAPADEQNRHPYARRFLQIAPVDAVPKNVSDHETIIESAEHEGTLPPLMIDPKEIPFPDEPSVLLASSFSNKPNKQLWFLPPVRTEGHPDMGKRSYFFSQSREFRQCLRGVAKISNQWEEPVAVTLQRLADEPALRDILLDGGALCVEESEGEATRIVLDVRPPEKGITAAIRSRVILGDPVLLADLPPGAKELALELRRDIEAIVPGGRIREAKGEGVDWSVPQTDERDIAEAGGVTEMKGYWHHLFALRQHVTDRAGDSSPLWNIVLRHSAPDGKYNHPYVLDLFSLNFWRQPWGRPAQATAWNQAVGDLLARELVGKPETPQERSERRWEGRHTLTQLEDHVVVAYGGDLALSDVLEWRLLYPLGTVIYARSLLLDQERRSRLDSELVLA